MSAPALDALPQEAVERLAVGYLFYRSTHAEWVLRWLKPHDFMDPQWRAVFAGVTALKPEVPKYDFKVEFVAARLAQGDSARQAALTAALINSAANIDSYSADEVIKALQARTKAREALVEVLEQRVSAMEGGGAQAVREEDKKRTGATPKKRARLRVPDLRKQVPESQHVWHGVLSPGAVTLLHSRAKLGKSFLAFGLLRALLRGENFLGRRTLPHSAQGPASVVYMTEEGPETLRIKTERFGIPDDAPVCFLSRRDPDYAALTFEESMAAGFEEARDFGAKLIIVDTLSAWSGLEMKAEFSALHAEAVFHLLKQHAKALNIPMLVLHHSSKQGKGPRGNSALEGAPDVLVKMSAPYPNAKRRMLTIDSRLCGSFVSRIDFESEGFSTVLKHHQGDEEDKLLAFIPPQAPGISINELCSEADLRKTWVYEALGRLKNQGKIHIEEGNGTRFFPSTVWKHPKPAA